MARIVWQKWCRRVKGISNPGRDIAYGFDKAGRHIDAEMPVWVKRLVCQAFTDGQNTANQRIWKPWEEFQKALTTVERNGED